MRLFSTILIALLLSNTALGATVVIQNDSDWDIHYLYLSPTYSNDWGPDQLGDHVIGSGSRYKLKGVSCDTYDVRIVDEDADECVITEVALCIFKEEWRITNDYLLECQGRTQGAANVVQANGTMTLLNASQWAIYELYISRSNQSTWGEDVLGDDIWGTGGTVDLWNIECANYDLRLVDEDSDVCELSEVFLCGAEGTVTLTDEVLLGCQAGF